MTEQAEQLKDKYFPVLDHGFVALKDWMGGDAAIAEAARNSYGFGTKRMSDDLGLIRYLLSHRHTTPFEMVELKFHMKLPIFVARQLVRHRTASLNEYSGRYSLMPMLFYTPPPEQLALQSTTNKQGRSEAVARQLYEATERRWSELRQDSAYLYEDLVNEGIARELARIDLPLSVYTEWYWKMDLHNLFHFLGLRCDPHAQWEARQYGNVMAGLVKAVAPIAFDAWLDYVMSAVTLSWGEVLCLRSELLGLHKSQPHEQVLARWEQYGLSKRESKEFLAKLAYLQAPRRDFGHFDLDLSKAKPGSYFYDEAQAAVPQADRPKADP